MGKGKGQLPKWVKKSSEKKIEKRHDCSTPHLTEEEIKSAFLTAVNKALYGRDIAIAAFKPARNTALDISALEVDAAVAEAEMQVILSQMQTPIREKASVVLDQDEDRQRFRTISSRYTQSPPAGSGYVGILPPCLL